MTDTERIESLEATVEIILARLDAMEQGGNNAMAIFESKKDKPEKPPEPEYEDPAECFQKLFDGPDGEVIFGIERGTYYNGVKLLKIGTQYLGIGAALDGHYKQIPDILMAYMTEECGEKWYNHFRRHPNQTGLTDYGTGVPHGFPCNMKKWKKPAK